MCDMVSHITDISTAIQPLQSLYVYTKYNLPYNSQLQQSFVRFGKVLIVSLTPTSDNAEDLSNMILAIEQDEKSQV